jgi:hypothetical protein
MDGSRSCEESLIQIPYRLRYYFQSWMIQTKLFITITGWNRDVLQSYLRACIEERT